MHAKYITYQQTHAFSPVVLDYLQKKDTLKSFYKYFPDFEGFKEAIEHRKTTTDRRLLVQLLQQQYATLKAPALVNKHIELLADQRTFTITTGHQLNIFSGPLYFIYKIVTAINLAKELKLKFPEYNFVPIYWMATEDHDFEEINHIKLEDKMLTWTKNAAGATGRLSTTDFADILSAYKGYLGIGEKVSKLSELVEKAYTHHKTLADATRELVNGLFGDQGLVCIDADEREFKKQFAPIMYQDITAQNSFKQIITSNAALEDAGYKPQVNPRKINFFYMTDGLRERIVEEDNQYKVLNTSISFTKETLQKEINEFPERFSPNVVMRPLYQEVLLPNLAYIGGGAEVTYWLQLKANFDFYKVAYPVLLLRNSALVIDERSAKKMERLEIDYKSIFNTATVLKNNWVHTHAGSDFGLADERQSISTIFEQIKLDAGQLDQTLYASADTAKTRTLKLIANLEEKMLRAEKRKHITSLNQIEDLKNTLFPSGVLQERILNIAPMYILYGDQFIASLLETFKPLDHQFTVLFA